MEKLYTVGYPYYSSLSLISLFNSPPHLLDLHQRFFGKLEPGLKTLIRDSKFLKIFTKVFNPE